MKKIYSNPELYLVKLEAADIVCESISGGNTGGGGEAEARRRGASIWGDE
jgi:hypothetical protein